jgi:hypothetical protein
MTPLPQESRFSGKISGSNPYFDGPKRAPCVLARNTAAMDIAMLWSPKPTMAKSITAISKTLVQMVTERLLKRSAK